MEPISKAPIKGHIPLQRMKIKMFGKTYTINPADDLIIHKATVGEDAQTQPSVFAFYATVRDMAQAKVDALNAQLEDRRSELDNEYRRAGELPGGLKITEDSIRRALRMDPDSTAIRDQILDAQHQVACLTSIVRAFEHRREMLLTVASRANNSTWNDRDVDLPEVHARITKIVTEDVRNLGAHPSKNDQVM